MDLHILTTKTTQVVVSCLSHGGHVQKTLLGFAFHAMLLKTMWFTRLSLTQVCPAFWKNRFVLLKSDSEAVNDHLVVNSRLCFDTLLTSSKPVYLIYTYTYYQPLFNKLAPMLNVKHINFSHKTLGFWQLPPVSTGLSS